MRLCCALVALVSLLGCASTGGQTTRSPGERVLIQADEGFIRTTEVSAERVDTVAVTANTAMRALVATMEQLGIEVNLVTPAKGEVGNPAFSASRRLAGEAMSRYVSCGTSMVGQRADNDRITFNILSTVRPAGAGSAVHTRIDAVARDLQGGNASQAIQCSSTGLLESRIHEGLRMRTGG